MLQCRFSPFPRDKGHADSEEAGLVQARFRLHIDIYQDAGLRRQHEGSCVRMLNDISDYNGIIIGCYKNPPPASIKK